MRPGGSERLLVSARRAHAGRATRMGTARLDVNAEHAGVRRRRRDGAAVDEHPAGARAGKLDDQLERGRLAGTVRTEKTGDRAGANGEREVVDCPDRAVALRQPLGDDRCGNWGNTIRLHADRVGHVPLARIGAKTELRLRPEVDKTRPDLRLGIDDLGWATALDARRSSALAHALGATPAQVSARISLAQVLPALVGALLGIPGGIKLIEAADPDSTTTLAPGWQLLAVAMITPLAVTALTAIPARIGARRPVVDVLRS